VEIEELYATYAGAARRLAYLLTGDAEVAEDIVQDCFVKLCGRLRPLRDIDDLHAYLQRMVVNAARSHFRYRGVRTRRAREAVAAYGPGGVGDASTRDHAGGVVERDRLRRALAELPARQREAVVLRHYLDLSEQQTAVQMGVTVGTVKALASRGRSAIVAGLAAADSGTTR
jgi:RNA polymerase sigma-70 factor (sigma-E family)